MLSNPPLVVCLWQRPLYLDKLTGAQNQAKRDGCNDHFTNRTHQKWTHALAFHLTEIDPQTHSCECKQEGPA